MGTDIASGLDGPKITLLTCIELPSQIPTALKYSSRSGDYGTTFLALTPHVEIALNQLGISCLVPERFHDEEDINQVGFQNIDALEGFTKYADDFLQENWSLLAEEDLRPASLNWYYLKLLFNTIAIRSFIVQKILHETRPEKVLYFDSREENFGQELYFYRESPWSRVIPLACQESGVSFESMPGNTDIKELWEVPGRKTGGLKPAVKMAGRKALGPGGLRLVRKGIRTFKVARHALGRHDNGNHSHLRPSILVLDRGYSLDQTIQISDERQELDVYHWGGLQFVPPYTPQMKPSSADEAGEYVSSQPSSHSSNEAKRLWKEISTRPEFNNFLRFTGVDCQPAISSRLQNFFENGIPLLISSYFNGRNLVRQLRPGAVVTSVLGDFRSKAFAVGTRREGIPVVVYRHGDSSAHLWGGGQDSSHWSQEKLGRSGMYIEKNELPMADYVLAFGEGDVKFLDGIKKTDVKIVPVGSAALDKLKISAEANDRDSLHRRFGLDPAKRTVMYVPTIMEGGVRSAPYQLRSPGLMHDIQKRLVETFGDYPDIQFVVKARESDGHTCPPIIHQLREHGTANCVVITAPFPTVLGMADMFVIDVASTIFLEILTTDRPILLCAHQLSKKLDPAGWSEEVRAMWDERVAYSNDLEEFIRILRQRLDQDNFAPVQSSDTLLKLFGTHKNDGASAERAYEFLKTLATETVNRSKEPAI
jgi:hypothetical protein